MAKINWTDEAERLIDSILNTGMGRDRGKYPPLFIFYSFLNGSTGSRRSL